MGSGCNRVGDCRQADWAQGRDQGTAAAGAKTGPAQGVGEAEHLEHHSCLAYVTHEDIGRGFAGDTLLPYWPYRPCRVPVYRRPSQKSPVGNSMRFTWTAWVAPSRLVNKQVWSSPPVAVPMPTLSRAHLLSLALHLCPSHPCSISRKLHMQVGLSWPPLTSDPDSSRAQWWAELTLTGLAAWDTHPLQSSSLLDSSSSSSSNDANASEPNPSISFEPLKADSTGILELPEQLSLLDLTREHMSSELLEVLMFSEVFSLLLHLSPSAKTMVTPTTWMSKGVCDLFDVSILSLWLTGTCPVWLGHRLSDLEAAWGQPPPHHYTAWEPQPPDFPQPPSLHGSGHKSHSCTSTCTVLESRGKLSPLHHGAKVFASPFLGLSPPHVLLESSPGPVCLTPSGTEPRTHIPPPRAARPAQYPAPAMPLPLYPDGRGTGCWPASPQPLLLPPILWPYGSSWTSRVCHSTGPSAPCTCSG